jgi:hypothetical protein
MRLSIGIVTWLALIGAAIFAANPAAAKHQSHKAPKTEYMRAVPSTPPSRH